MARGTPLTPQQVETALAVYERTGNASKAARAIDVEPSTVTRLLARRGEQTRAQLHARACEKGIRKGRAQLARVGKLLDGVLKVETKAGVSLEPKDIAALANALARNVAVRVEVASREDSRRQAALTRAKTRAEIEFLRMRNAGTLPAEKHDVTTVAAIVLKWPDAPDDDANAVGGDASSAPPEAG